MESTNEIDHITAPVESHSKRSMQAKVDIESINKGVAPRLRLRQQTQARRLRDESDRNT